MGRGIAVASGSGQHRTLEGGGSRFQNLSRGLDPFKELRSSAGVSGSSPRLGRVTLGRVGTGRPRRELSAKPRRIAS